MAANRISKKMGSKPGDPLPKTSPIRIIMLIILFVSLVFFGSSLYLAISDRNTEDVTTADIIDSQQYVKVSSVTDGDTIVLENGDTIRYLGVDTPETHHPTIGLECYGNEATELNKALVEGKTVRLIKDETDQDRYGRLLRYVITDDNLFVNYELTRRGAAQVLSISPDNMFYETLLQGQLDAKEDNLGVWAECYNSNNN